MLKESDMQSPMRPPLVFDAAVPDTTVVPTAGFAIWKVWNMVHYLEICTAVQALQVEKMPLH